MTANRLGSPSRRGVHLLELPDREGAGALLTTRNVAIAGGIALAAAAMTVVLDS